MEYYKKLVVIVTITVMFAMTIMYGGKVLDFLMSVPDGDAVIHHVMTGTVK